MAEKIDALEKVGKKIKKAAIDPTDLQPERLAPSKDRFDSLMVKNDSTTIDARKVDTSRTSIMDEVTKINSKVEAVKLIPPTELVAQAHQVINQIDMIKQKLNSPNLEIKSSVQNLLRNKLSHIDESLKVALNKVGIEYNTAEKVATSPQNPIERFLGFLTDGQHKLQTLASDVNTMHLNRQEISPATMLAMQIKVGYIQQELELFTSLLNKGLESVKTIMNVQV